MIYIKHVTIYKRKSMVIPKNHPQKPLKSKKKMLLDYISNEEAVDGLESAMACRPTEHCCPPSPTVATNVAATILRLLQLMDILSMKKCRDEKEYKSPHPRSKKINATDELQSCPLATESSSTPKLLTLQSRKDKRYVKIKTMSVKYYFVTGQSENGGPWKVTWCHPKSRNLP
ncbi:hypothetical protein BCV71DRAFT_259654 [Rhizopus microsporus]|uniref:Uncharacterized protein n=2 Tax=Rhizopus TaxID=4842 RepID=A0A1X0SG96_RHIZD|nr:hypothetical protein BCV71DRAFT_259654 [Rhizopus microsporus]